MKRIITSVLALALTWGVNAQVYHTKDFEDLSLTSGGWTTQVVVDTTNWQASSFNGDNFAKISNWNGTANRPAEAWLISPAIDLSGATSPVLNFETIMKYTGPQLELYVSTDYDGTSNPTQQGTWDTLTTQAMWDVDATAWGNWTPSGDVSLSPYISPTVYIAFKYTGSSSDGSTWEVDNIIVQEPGTTSSITSVYEIQNTTLTTGDSPLNGQTVNTGGIVTAVRNGMDTTGFYIQNGSGPWSGIYVYHPVTADVLSLNIGDSVTFTADVTEYNNLTELKNVVNLTVVSSGNTVAVTTITTADVNTEQYEGVLIKVMDATCTNDNAGFGMFEVNDGSGPALVDDQIYQFANPTLNNIYNVTGVIDYSFAEYKILPRDISDIEMVGAVPVNTVNITEGVNIIFNNNQLQVNGSLQGVVNVYSVTGQLVKTQNIARNRVIDLNDLHPGIYMAKYQDKVLKVAVQ